MKLLHLLAAGGGDVEFPAQLIIVVVLMVLAAAKSLYDKAKEQQARQQQAERPSRPTQTPGEGGRSVEEIVRTMREARETPPPPVVMQRGPIPQARPVPQRPSRPAPKRRVTGQVAEMQRIAKRQKEQETVHRLVQTMPETVAVEAVAGPIEIHVADRDEARKGIILAEILGPPVALRRQQGMWEL